MTTYTEPAATRSTDQSAGAMNSLASATYVVAATLNLSAIDALDAVIEVEATPGTVAGNKQLALFAQVSFDGTNFSTGPTSGTTTTDEAVLFPIGVLPLPTNATLQRKAFSLLSTLGFVPPWVKVIAKNDSGAALAASGNALYYTTYTGSGV